MHDSENNTPPTAVIFAGTKSPNPITHPTTAQVPLYLALSLNKKLTAASGACQFDSRESGKLLPSGADGPDQDETCGKSNDGHEVPHLLLAS
jgi:hypothetical protein